MMIEDIAGTYTEAGTWHDTNGQSGSLSGCVTVTQSSASLSFRYADGVVQTAVFAAGARQAALRGASSSGTLYIGANAIILEYTANVDGRNEQNTDVWTFRDGVLHRAGLIRQSERVIWFDAVMSRVD